jgi:Ku70/Ku80 beta-barrel domain
MVNNRRQDRTMPRTYWKGYLRLSLVTCPIELLPATSQAEKTLFHQINKQTGHRLRQQMVDEETGRVVDTGHKGRGYELTKGKYVEIEEEELKAIQVESTRTLPTSTSVIWTSHITLRRTARQERKPSSSSATPCRTKNVLRWRASLWLTGST